jgi:hypothetical protein
MKWYKTYEIIKGEYVRLLIINTVERFCQLEMGKALPPVPQAVQAAHTVNFVEY